VGEIAVDRGDEAGDALEGAAANARAGDFSEPALDQVQPGATGGNEVKVHARMTAEPAVNGWTFVRAQIVEDDVNRAVGGRRRLDPVENRTNSLVLRFGRHVPRTAPSRTRSAAYKHVVPWRM
jgi:hypothetical protein